MNDIKLGHWLKDRITGFEGFAVARNLTYSGMVQFALQPHGEKKTDNLPIPHFFDVATLEFIDEGISSVAMSLPIIFPFNIGEEVRDRVTGFSGIVVAEMVYINGCIHYKVVGKQRILEKLFGWAPEGKSYEWQRLELVSAAKKTRRIPELFKKPATTVAAATAAPQTVTAAPTGGPNIRAYGPLHDLD